MTAIVYGTNGISITASSANLTVNSIAVTIIGGTNTLVVNTTALVIGNTTSNTNIVSKLPFGDGTTRCSTGATIGYSSLSLTNTQTFTASGTWVKPASSKFILVRMWGGGGSGGAGSGTLAIGGGGGAFNEVILGAACVTANVTVTVGAGGNSVVSGSNGFSGGYSTFGSYANAAGGFGGSKNSLVCGCLGNGGSCGGGVNDKLIMAYTSGINLSNTSNSATMTVNTGFIQVLSNYRGFSSNSSLYSGGSAGSSKSGRSPCSVFGGGGGTSYCPCGSYAAGVSIYGGNGGVSAGFAPGGGGGGYITFGYAGGNGQVIVYTYS